MTKFSAVQIRVADGATVSGSFNSNIEEYGCLYLLAHGAGAGMEHSFMTTVASDLADQGVATLRFHFPYMEKGSRRPDHKNKLIDTWRSVLDFARGKLPHFDSVFAGGKSMGGRMCSQTFAIPDLASNVKGLVFLGFPLHPAGKPGTERAAHLQDVKIPMLFLQGSRDKLAELDLLEPVVDGLKHADLHVIAGADHGFDVRKKDGRSKQEVMEELVNTAAKWMLR